MFLEFRWFWWVSCKGN